MPRRPITSAVTSTDSADKSTRMLSGRSPAINPPEQRIVGLFSIRVPCLKARRDSTPSQPPAPPNHPARIGDAVLLTLRGRLSTRASQSLPSHFVLPNRLRDGCGEDFLARTVQVQVIDEHRLRCLIRKNLL